MLLGLVLLVQRLSPLPLPKLTLVSLLLCSVLDMTLNMQFEIRVKLPEPVGSRCRCRHDLNPKKRAVNNCNTVKLVDHAHLFTALPV